MTVNYFALTLFISLASQVLSCSSPEVISTSYTTLDATVVTGIAYISEFEIKCNSGDLTNLYAELDGHIFPVSAIGNNRYQVSWTEDPKTARSGTRKIRILDEEAHASVRKAARAGEDPSTVAALTEVSLYHPGASNGPWFKSEFIATGLSFAIAFYAFNSRTHIVY